MSDFIKDLLNYAKDYAKAIDAEAKKRNVYGPGGPLSSFGQSEVMKKPIDDEYGPSIPQNPVPDKYMEPGPVEWKNKNKKNRMYVRNNDGTFDLMDVEFDDNGNPVTLRRVYRGPEGGINA
jgi:hypothetical protein